MRIALISARISIAALTSVCLAAGALAASRALPASRTTSAWAPSFHPAAAGDLTAIQRYLRTPAATEIKEKFPALDRVMRLNPESPDDLVTAGPLVAEVMSGGGLRGTQEFGVAYLRAAEDVGREIERRRVELVDFIGLDSMSGATLNAQVADLKRARTRYAMYDASDVITEMVARAIDSVAEEKARRTAARLKGDRAASLPVVYWGLTRPDEAGLRQIRQRLDAYKAARRVYEEHLEPVEALMKASDGPHLNDAGLRFDGLSIGLVDKVAVRARVNARELWRRMQTIPQLSDLIAATDLPFWEKVRQLGDRMDVLYAEIQWEYSKRFTNWELYPSRPVDPNFLRGVEDESTVGQVPDDHIFRLIKDGPLENDTIVREDYMIRLLTASRKVDMAGLQRALHAVIDGNERKQKILSASMPLIYHSLEMPRTIRARFRQMVASFAYGAGWGLTPYTFHESRQWIDWPGAQFAREMLAVPMGWELLILT